jgi:hypothetical protein
MASDARTKMVLELAAEFVEDHVRTRSAQPFSLAEVTQSLSTMLQEAGVAIAPYQPTSRGWLIGSIATPSCSSRAPAPPERGSRASTQARLDSRKIGSPNGPP